MSKHIKKKCKTNKGRFNIKLSRNRVINGSSGSLHTYNNPATLFAINDRALKRVAPCVTPTIGHTRRTHEDMQLAAMALSLGQELLIERVTSNRIGRIDAKTGTMIFEFKKGCKQYRMRAGLFQVYTYGKMENIQNLTLLVEMQHGGCLWFDAYNQAEVRKKLVEWANFLGVNLVFCAPSNTPDVVVDEDGFTPAFSFAKQHNVGIFQLYNAAMYGPLAYKPRKAKKEMLCIDYEQAKVMFGVA